MSTEIKKVHSPTICRGCLTQIGVMKNMSEYKLDEAFYKITTVEIKRSEGLSELICTKCEETLKSCFRFRLQCQRSDVILRDSATLSSHSVLKTQTVSNDKERKIEAEKTAQSSILMEINEDNLTYSLTPNDCETKLELPCPYQCEGTFSKRYLPVHVMKIHKKKFEIQIKYYCIYSNCAYNIDSNKNKSFTHRKYLIQHYNKVHETKIYCEKCGNNFVTDKDFTKHLSNCNEKFSCSFCDLKYKTDDRLSVHISRKHPDLYEQYKIEKKRKKTIADSKNAKKPKTATQEQCCNTKENLYDLCDSPKRSFATQTLTNKLKGLKNDISLAWQDQKKNNITTQETQTVFDNMLLRSENSEDDIFFENGSLSDIQTQTWPIEFGLSRSCKVTNNCHTQTRTESPDLSIKETQTCYCMLDSPKSVFNFSKYFDSVTSSPTSMNLTSTETQTADFSRCSFKSDVLLSFSSAETQTYNDDDGKNSF